MEQLDLFKSTGIFTVAVTHHTCMRCGGVWSTSREVPVKPTIGVGVCRFDVSTEVSIVQSHNTLAECVAALSDRIDSIESRLQAVDGEMAP